MIATESITSRQDYSKFVMKHLAEHIYTAFVLIVQHDGFILNPHAWSEQFLDYDYVGAPWWYDDEYNVGNGGFSLRSRKLLAFLQADASINQYEPEDHQICRVYGSYLRQRGFRFAPESIASRFSIEGTLHCPTNKPVKYGSVWTNEFGFHGYPRTDIRRWPDRHLFRSR
jgi:hypothetical protein